MSTPRITFVFTVLYGIAFAGNIAGNILVCLVVKRCKNLHNITSFLLVNLAIGDLTLGVCGSIHLVISSTTNSELFCSITSTAVYLSATVSTYTIAVLAIERCIAITRPLYSRCNTSTSMLKVIVPVIWIFSALVSIPSIVFFIDGGNDKKILSCWDALTQDNFPPFYKIILLVFMYFLPMSAIGMSYWKIIRYGTVFLFVYLIVHRSLEIFYFCLKLFVQYRKIKNATKAVVDSRLIH